MTRPSDDAPPRGRLRSLIGEFRVWAIDADNGEDGWESHYPKYSEMVEASQQCMIATDIDDELRSTIAEAWDITEEREDLCDFAEQNSEKCWSVVEFVARCDRPNARWQAFSAAVWAGARAEQLLRAGTKDPHPYCRRRAILALAELRADLLPELRRVLQSDADEYNRRIGDEH